MDLLNALCTLQQIHPLISLVFTVIRPSIHLFMKAAEAQVIMDFKSIEYTIINSTGHWKNVFSQLFEKLRYIWERYNGILRETAARRIQRTVWRRLYKWDPRIHRPPYDPRSDELYVSTIKRDHVLRRDRREREEREEKEREEREDREGRENEGEEREEKES